MERHFLKIEGLTKTFPALRGGHALTVFEDINFAIDKGEFVCIIGHSGCGKSTILNIIAGLDDPSAGLVVMDEREVSGAEPRPRCRVPGPRADAAVGQKECRIRGHRAGPTRAASRLRDLPALFDLSVLPAPSIKTRRTLGRHETARRYRARVRDRAQNAAA